MMNVVQLIGRLAQQARHWTGRHVVLVGVWIVALTVLELRGRQSRGDLADALALFQLLFLLAVTMIVDFRWSTQVLGAIRGAVQGLLAQLFSGRIIVGLDLRCDPPVPRAMPSRWCICMSLLLLGNAAAAALAPRFPLILRTLLHDRFYLGYLALLVGMWTLAMLATLVLSFVAWAGIHDYFVHSYTGHGPRPRHWERIAVASALFTILFAILLLPAWTPLALSGVLLLVWSAVALSCRGGLTLLWKRHDRPRVFSFDGRWGPWLTWTAPMLLAGCLVWLMRGYVIVPTETLPTALLVMPITSFLGLLLSWALVAGILATLVGGLRQLRMRIALNPQRLLLPVLHVSGQLSRAERRTLRHGLDQQAWQVRFAPAKPASADVCVRLCQHLAEQDSSWPLPVTLQSLTESRTLERLERRAEIQYRRLVLNGLERLFKRASRIKRKQGTGYWIGLQYWFVMGLTRDKDTDFTEDREAPALATIVGFPYHYVIPARARRHFGEITSALQVDIIFVEDGVAFRKLVRVLRVLFEIYDIHGGQRRAEEPHFTGLPGVRVMLHDFTFGDPPEKITPAYPEPDYEDIGRARILHVFRDRGEHEELATDPVESDDVPLLSGK